MGGKKQTKTLERRRVNTMNELWATLWFVSAIYLLIGVFALIWNLIRLPPNFKDKGLVSTCIITATFCCWLMWIVVYMSQMYPLPGVAPQVAFPENFNCSAYDPTINQTSCYTPTSLF